MTATAMPTPTAWRTLAPELTMYAAIRVFPCPGSRACQAPNATASSSASATSGTPWFPTRPAKGPPSTPGRTPTAATSAPQLEAGAASEAPGATSKLAVVTFSGLASSACGYRRSSSLTLAAGTDDAVTARPSTPAAVISRQPVRSASVVSSTSTWPRSAIGEVEQSLESRDVQARLAGAEPGGAAPVREGQRRSVDGDVQVAGHPRARGVRPGLELRGTHLPVAVGVLLRAQLLRGDLGDVDRVHDAQLAGRGLEARVVVDGEVAERVRGRGGRRPQREADGEQADGEDAAERAHGRPPSDRSVRTASAE